MNSDAISFLRACHITKLSTAARMAGLKFKNGAPGYDKAGIIEKLTYHPAYMAATVATIKRMDAGIPTVELSNTNNSFLSDLAEETAQNNAIPPLQEKPVPEGIHQEFGNRLDSALRAIGNLQETVSGIKAEYITENQARRVANTQFDSNIKGYSNSIETLKAEIIELRQSRPIQINLENKPPLVIEGGQHSSFPKLLKYLQANRRVILTGPAGTGKSMAAKNAAKALGVEFYLQTPVTQGHELIGYRDAGGVFHETPLFKAFTQGGLILIDEADACLADALLVANPIFDGNGFAMFGDGKMHKMHPDFLVIFNMNSEGNGATMEYAGRNRLDGATLARFGLRIRWGIDARIEASMARGFTLWLEAVRAVRALMVQRSIYDVNATPRHTAAGALVLSKTDTEAERLEILEDTLKSGGIGEIWSIVLALPQVTQFIRGF